MSSNCGSLFSGTAVLVSPIWCDEFALQKEMPYIVALIQNQIIRTLDLSNNESHLIADLIIPDVL